MKNKCFCGREISVVKIEGELCEFHQRMARYFPNTLETEKGEYMFGRRVRVEQ